ncbi:MAG: oligopeptide transporter, OPT family [Holophagaceae bacterium]|uniref:Oligopeptide transporter, OPT family n=1 Tax=Candidatus Geothrix skivensis TaxID=2954439 RepID=A0A9D7SG44_9BACT|nr:oligopeptide transporter, OPT family [Candidatus Geothrix skivensis]
MSGELDSRGAVLGGESVAEFTFRAIATGILLGVTFGAANAYLGLRVGMTISASIPATVLTIALFRLLRIKGTLLEANMAKTVASASTSLATGTIFTIPALFLWGITPPFMQVVALCFLGGVFGIMAMIPLRRLLIVQSAGELPYPEGAACAEVLRASYAGLTGGTWIFYGIGIGFAVKLAISLFYLLPAEIGVYLPVLPRAYLATAVAPALLGIGYILGFKRSAVIVSGAALASLVLIPMIAHFGAGLASPVAPEPSALIRDMNDGQIWKAYVRFIGAGAVAAAGIYTVLQTLPTITRTFLSVLQGLLRRKDHTAPHPERTDRDLPGGVVVGALVAVLAVAAFVPGVFGQGMTLLPRLVCALGVGVCGVLFVTVAARIVGLIGVSSQPTSGITLITLMLVSAMFVVAGWKTTAAMAAVLTVGTIVAIAASKAGDISQDLKTGAMVGATPALQQLGQLIGAACACWAVAATVLLLGKVYAFGSQELPAPQAMLMKTVIEGVLSGNLPWPLVLMGVGITVPVILCGISALSFAIGVYLPLASMAAIFLGGCVRQLVDQRRAARGETLGDEGDPGILAASGLVAGEGLAGVVVAGLVAAKLVSSGGSPLLTGFTGRLAGLVLLVLVGAFLGWAASQRKTLSVLPK